LSIEVVSELHGIDGYVTGLDVVLFLLSTPKKESGKTD
jgi:hypothetical protein